MGILDLCIDIHVHFGTWTAACGDADKSRPPSLVSFSAYTSFFPNHKHTHTHTQTRIHIHMHMHTCTHTQVSMESLNLSHVKATDRGISLLLHTPLTHLTNLTLSHTRITSTTLTALPQGQCEVYILFACLFVSIMCD